MRQVAQSERFLAIPRGEHPDRHILPGKISAGGGFCWWWLVERMRVSFVYQLRFLNSHSVAWMIQRMMRMMRMVIIKRIMRMMRMMVMMVALVVLHDTTVHSNSSGQLQYSLHRIFPNSSIGRDSIQCTTIVKKLSRGWRHNHWGPLHVVSSRAGWDQIVRRPTKPTRHFQLPNAVTWKIEMSVTLMPMKPFHTPKMSKV